MKISLEQFIKSVTMRAKAVFVIVLAEKVIDILREDENVFSLARNLLDKSWLWEESLGASPLEIYEYLDSSNEDIVEAQDLSLICQFDRKTPEPILTAIHTVINAGCIVVKYAYEIMDSNSMPPTIIGETFDDRDIPIGIESVVKMNLIDEAWIERAISYLMLTHKSDDPNALGEPIKREELMSLA
jgi:hypothetical protein